MKINKDNLHLEVAILKELGWEFIKNEHSIVFTVTDKITDYHAFPSFSHIGDTEESVLYNAVLARYHIPYIGSVDKALSLPLEDNHHWDIVYFSEDWHTVSLLHVLPPQGEIEPQWINSWFYNDEAGRYATLPEKMCAVWLKYRKESI